MSEPMAPPRGSYDAWMADCIAACRCVAPHCPCDGVMAGGYCDGITDDLFIDDEPYDDWDDEKWADT